MDILASAPESYSKIIRRSFILYRESFVKIIIPALLLSLVVFSPRLLSDLVGQDLFFNLPTFSPYRLWLFIVNLAALIFFIAILWHMHCVIRHRIEPLKEDFKVGLYKVINVLIATVIQSLIILILALLVFGFQLLLAQYQLLFSSYALGIFLTAVTFIGQLFLVIYGYTLFIFIIPLIAIEEEGILSSLRQSASLVWNHWWRVFSVQVTPWLFYLFLLLVIRYIFKIEIHIYFLEYAPHTIYSTLLQIVIFFLFVPWLAALLLVQLKDLEIRKKISDEYEKRRAQNSYRL